MTPRYKLPKVTFLLEEFSVPSAGQQLLDRFLLGYNRDGVFHTPTEGVGLFARNVAQKEALQARVNDGLQVFRSEGEAIESARFYVAASKGAGDVFDSAHARQVLQGLRPRAKCFLHGIPENSQVVEEIARLTSSRTLAVATGTASGTTFLLPHEATPDPAALRRAVIVTTGAFPVAEIHALEGMLFLGQPQFGGTAPRVTAIAAQEVWPTVYSAQWNKLFAAAVSRSNTIQGDPTRDGRTQDIVGLRLVENLVREPRAWLLQQSGGVEVLVVILNGALQDMNAALELANKEIFSTQLYRPATVAQEHFSLLAAKVETFFRAEGPLPDNKIAFIPNILDRMRG